MPPGVNPPAPLTFKPGPCSAVPLGILIPTKPPNIWPIEVVLLNLALPSASSLNAILASP